MENNKKKLIGSIIVIGLFIALIINIAGNKPDQQFITENYNENEKEQIKLFTLNEHILGNPNAQITIIEYSDTECPFCKNFHMTMQEVVRQSNGTVAWIYRHYPIAQLHPKAFHEAEATECAWEQGGNVTFWRYIDRLFEITPSNNNLDETELVNIANYIGLDISSFNNCLLSGKFQKKITNEIISGVDLGVQGTPTSFIIKNNKIVDIIQGAQPLEIVLAKIKVLLD